jgi:hypothetical protein
MSTEYRYSSTDRLNRKLSIIEPFEFSLLSRSCQTYENGRYLVRYLIALALPCAFLACMIHCCPETSLGWLLPAIVTAYNFKLKLLFRFAAVQSVGVSTHCSLLNSECPYS